MIDKKILRRHGLAEAKRMEQVEADRAAQEADQKRAAAVCEWKHQATARSVCEVCTLRVYCGK